jgi:hypothetical protein
VSSRPSPHREDGQVHVCHILAKSGVAGRGEVAAIAHRRASNGDDPSPPWLPFLGAASRVRHFEDSIPGMSSRTAMRRRGR